MLGRAFSENPIARAALDRSSPEDRLAKVTRLHDGLIAAGLRRGLIEIVRDGERIAGAHVVIPPGGWPVGARAWASMALGALGTGVRGALRYAMYDDRVHALHPKEP